MVRRGPLSRLEEVENAILDLLATSSAFVHGLGFREIHRKLQAKPKRCRAGSFSTLEKCLRNLKLRHVIRRDPESRKYFINLLELYARYDKDLIMKTISKSNIFGGGQLFHPELEMFLNKQTVPKERPKIFGAICAFIEADLQGAFGFKDKGFLNIETFEGRWSENLHVPRRGSGWITTETQARATSRETPPFVKLIMPRLNVARIMENWLRIIWRYAKENHLVRNGLTPEKITDVELERIWLTMFKGVKAIALAEFVDAQKFLEWLKTSEGKNRFAKAMKAMDMADRASIS